MKRYYMFRSKSIVLVGPLSQEQAVEAIRDGRVSSEAEVIGPAEVWVQLSHVKRIKQIYPELSLATQSRGSLFSGFKPTYVFSSLVLLVIIIGGVFFQDKNPFKPKLITPFSESTADQLLATRQINRFKKYAKSSLEPIIEDDEITLPRSYIPYVRTFVMLDDGNFERRKLVNFTISSPHAPRDCSYQRWTRRWNSFFESVESSSWEKTFWDDKFSWLNHVLWDPSWIARRQDMKEWPFFGSYYIACLRQSEKALQKVATSTEIISKLSDEKVEIAKQFANRLKLVKALVLGTSFTVPDNTGLLGIVNCFDTATSKDELAKCRALADEQTEDIISYVNERQFLRYLTIKIYFSDSVEDGMWEDTYYGGKTVIEDALTGFNYLAEKAYLTEIYSGPGHESALAKARAISPGFSVPTLFH